MTHYTNEPDDLERMKLEVADWIATGYTVVTTQSTNLTRVEVFVSEQLQGTPMYGACSVYAEDGPYIGMYGSRIVQRFKGYYIFVVGSENAQSLSGKLNQSLDLLMEASAPTIEEVISYVKDYAGLMPVPIDQK